MSHRVKFWTPSALRHEKNTTLDTTTKLCSSTSAQRSEKRRRQAPHSKHNSPVLFLERKWLWASMSATSLKTPFQKPCVGTSPADLNSNPLATLPNFKYCRKRRPPKDICLCPFSGSDFHPFPGLILNPLSGHDLCPFSGQNLRPFLNSRPQNSMTRGPKMRAKIVSRKWTRNRVHFLPTISLQNTFCLIFRFLVQKMDTKSCPFSGHDFGPRFWLQNAQNLKSAPRISDITLAPFLTSIWTTFQTSFWVHFWTRFDQTFDTFSGREFGPNFELQLAPKFQPNLKFSNTDLHFVTHHASHDFLRPLPNSKPKAQQHQTYAWHRNHSSRMLQLGSVPLKSQNSFSTTLAQHATKTDSARFDVTHSATHCVT